MATNALGREPDGRLVPIFDAGEARYPRPPQLALFPEPEEPFRRCPACGRWFRETFPRVVGRDADGAQLVRWEPRSVCTFHRVTKDNELSEVQRGDVDDADGCLDDPDGDPVDDARER